MNTKPCFIERMDKAFARSMRKLTRLALMGALATLALWGGFVTGMLKQPESAAVKPAVPAMMEQTMKEMKAVVDARDNGEEER